MTPRGAFKLRYRTAREQGAATLYAGRVSIARGDCRRLPMGAKFWHGRFHEELLWQFEDVARHAEHTPTPVARLYAGVLRGALYSLRQCRRNAPGSFIP